MRGEKEGGRTEGMKKAGEGRGRGGGKGPGEGAERILSADV